MEGRKEERKKGRNTERKKGRNTEWSRNEYWGIAVDTGM
jgi:hypothetical protein